MMFSIEAAGTREAVKHSIGAQAAALRKEHEHAQPVIAIVVDEVARRLRNSPGTEFKVSAALVIDINVEKGVDVPAPTDTIEVNGLRISRADFDRMLADQQTKTVKPIIGTPVAEHRELISSDE